MRAHLLQEYLEATAARRPHGVALVMGAERISYGELESVSNQLADALIEAGCRPGDRVCLLAPKAPATIAAMLATLKAGCIYVPVDVAAPARRTAELIAAVEPAAAFLATEAQLLYGDLRDLGALDASMAVLTASDADGRPDAPHRSCRSPHDGAHILFTSGSTGRQKGVVVTHASVVAFIEWAAAHFGITPGERLSGHPPPHFDLSTFDIYASIKMGAELHLLPAGTILPGQLADFIASAELHQLFCVPSALAYLSRHGAIPEAGFPSLRRILWCGEVLPTPVLIDWMRRHPQATFTNLYGPTEATIASSHHTVAGIPDDEREQIPIGTACTGEELIVLGETFEPAPDGEVGELCIGGVGLSPGYWRAPELTTQAFILDPRPGRAGERLYRTGDYAHRDAAGVLHFLGRRDGQVKSRGHRIELGEIETAVRALPGVGECAVVGVPTDGFEGVSICAAVAFDTAPSPTSTELRAQLRQILPGYMLPARWRLVDALPKNGNGKIDRRLVRELFDGGAPAA